MRKSGIRLFSRKYELSTIKFLVPTNFKIVPTGLQTTTEALCTRPRVICVLQCKKSSVKVAKCAICKTSIVIHTHTSMYLNGSHLPKSRIKRRYSCINTQFNVSSLSALAQGRRNRGRGQGGGGDCLPSQILTGIEGKKNSPLKLLLNPQIFRPSYGPVACLLGCSNDTYQKFYKSANNIVCDSYITGGFAHFFGQRTI